MLIDDIRTYVVRPSLQCASLWTQAAEVLLVGTILVETGAEHLMQVHGSAYGLYQIEHDTHKETKVWLSNRMNKNMIDRVLATCCMAMLPSDDEPLVYNLRYATLIARIIYYRNKNPLPAAQDASAMAEFHKMVYNTAKGKADPVKNTPIFQRVIDESID